MASLDFSTGLVLVIVSLFSALTALFLAGVPMEGRRVVFRRRTLADNTDRTLFKFRDGQLIEATAPALLFVGAPVKNNNVWAALCARLEAETPGIGDALQTLDPDGTRIEFQAGAHQSGWAWHEGNAVFIELASETGDRKPVAAACPVNPADMCDAAPILVWTEEKNGTISWINQRYRDLCARASGQTPPRDGPYPALFAADTAAGATQRRPVAVHDKKAPLWFETSTHSAPDGTILHFAIHADPVVKAEAALRNFIQTLTKTFAHLPTGLAIFDKDRQLALFNPALADLTALEPDWLTARPTLYAFLDRLRENRHLPEPKDYKSWRYRIAELEKAAEHGTYEENWPLPTGQTFRVTGRPHPDGAVAFLFEDITSEIALRRQFRSELALGQSVLDSEADAIAVFSASDELVMSNDAYASLWGIAPDEMLARITLDEARQHWLAKSNIKSAANPGGSRLASNYRDRTTSFVERLELTGGVVLAIRISPLSQGATLYRFSTIADAPQVASVAGEKICVEA